MKDKVRPQIQDRIDEIFEMFRHPVTGKVIMVHVPKVQIIQPSSVFQN